MIFNKIYRRLLRYYAWILFKKKVRVYGLFRIGNINNISIGENCAINTGVYILGYQNVVIGNNVVLSARCMLLDGGLDLENFLTSNHFTHIADTINIEDNVWIGAGSIILPGVTVGHHSVIGAGSIVTKNVPPYSVVAGNPAKFIKQVK